MLESMKQTGEYVLEARGIRKSFGALKAVDGVDLAIPAGQFLALLGPNGAGKTTLVEMIEGIQKPDSGSIEILGMRWSGNEKDLRRRIGVALQETRFYDRLTTEETLKMFASFYRCEHARVEEILELIRLAEKRKTYTMRLSGGQRQRLALGVALLNQPSLLLLDEPTTGLDPNARRDVWAILRDLKTRGVTMILTTHYMEEAEALCERIVIMDRGRFLAAGSLQELLRTEGGGEIIEFNESGTSRESFQDMPGLIRLESAAQGRIRAVVAEVAPALNYLLQRFATNSEAMKDLTCRKMNLDDLFTLMTGRHLDVHRQDS